MNIDFNTFISLAGFILAFTTTICGAILWYVNSERKKYAAERAFIHLQNDLTTLSNNTAFLLKELKDLVEQAERNTAGKIDYQMGEIEKQLEVIARDILEMKFRLGISSDRTKDND